MRGLKIMRDAGWPVVFDATHSVQLPGGAGAASAGQPEFIELAEKEITFRRVLSLTNGPNMATIEARDLLGKHVRLTVRWMMDAQPPQLLLDSLQRAVRIVARANEHLLVRRHDE